MSSWGKHFTRVTENRYFVSAKVRLTYLKAYGRTSLQGLWQPGDANSLRQPHLAFTVSWVLPLEAAIARLLPALGATHALLSLGGMHVPAYAPLNEHEFRVWRRAFDNTSVRPIWKTYTMPHDEYSAAAGRHFQVFNAGALVRSLQANITLMRNASASSSSLYIDNRGHMSAEGNNFVNVEMIRHIFR